MFAAWVPAEVVPPTGGPDIDIWADRDGPELSLPYPAWGFDAGIADRVLADAGLLRVGEWHGDICGQMVATVEMAQ